MTFNERRNAISHALRKCPDCMTVGKIKKWTCLGVNHIYKLIQTGELTAFIYQDKYTVFKSDLVDLLAERWFSPHKNYRVKGYENIIPDNSPISIEPRKHTKPLQFELRIENDSESTELEKRYESCPNLMSPRQISNWTVIGINNVYNIIKSGELPSFRYQERYLVSKNDLLKYLHTHRNDESRKSFRLRQSDLSIGQSTEV